MGRSIGFEVKRARTAIRFVLSGRVHEASSILEGIPKEGLDSYTLGYLEAVQDMLEMITEKMRHEASLPLLYSDEEARNLLQILVGEPSYPSLLSKMTGIPAKRVEEKLAKLEREGLVASERRGRVRIYFITPLGSFAAIRAGLSNRMSEYLLERLLELAEEGDVRRIRDLVRESYEKGALGEGIYKLLSQLTSPKFIVSYVKETLIQSEV